MCSTSCHRVSSLRLILSDAHMEQTLWCSNGAYFTMLNWSLYYAYAIKIWYYDISMDYYYSKDTFMDVTIYTDTVCYMSWNLWTILFRLGRYEPSQFHVFFEHRGSDNVKLGIVQGSCTCLARTLVCDALWICVSQATKVIWTFVMHFVKSFSLY